MNLANRAREDALKTYVSDRLTPPQVPVTGSSIVRVSAVEGNGALAEHLHGLPLPVERTNI